MLQEKPGPTTNNSAQILHVSCASLLASRAVPEWRNGRRSGLKIRRGRPRVGSTPTSGTNPF